MDSRRCGITLGAILLMTGCGSVSGSSVTPPASAGTARVRFAEGAPELEAIIGGVPQKIGAAYLQVDGRTVNSQFAYGTLTQFVLLPPGEQSLSALDTLGYRVGPLRSSSLAAGESYTLILIGTYPKYRVLTFEEPAHTSGAQLSLYEASPSLPQADFGSFEASTNNGFKKLGSATLGTVVTVSLGKAVSNFGAYAGKGIMAFPGAALKPAQINTFDKKNALPFHTASRFSLFLFDSTTSSLGPVFGSLDR